MSNIKGKVAIITGASRGIGKSIAFVLADMGVKVALVARRKECLLEIERKIKEDGGDAISIVADLTKHDSVEKVVDTVKKMYGTISILVNNAARTGMSGLGKLSVKAWENVFQLNLTVPFKFVHYLIEDMKKQDSSWIINISSEAAITMCTYSGAYGISKHALNRLTEQIDLEYRDFNVHAVAICPGWIDTQLSMNPELAGISKKDILPPEQIAETVRWIISQPVGVRVGPTISITPNKQKASLINGANTFFEQNPELI